MVGKLNQNQRVGFAFRSADESDSSLMTSGMSRFSRVTTRVDVA